MPIWFGIFLARLNRGACNARMRFSVFKNRRISFVIHSFGQLGLGLALAAVVSSVSAGDWPMTSPLRFRADKTFKVVAFGDIHWEDKTTENAQTLQVMDTILAEEKPDMVMYVGDNCPVNTLEAVRRGYEQLTKPVVRRGLPWAMTMGNHDAEKGGLSRKAVFSSALAIPGNLSRLGPTNVHGISNFTLPVMDHAGKQPAALLYVLDSNASYNEDGLDTYDWIRWDQICWYREASEAYRRLNQGRYLPSYAFFHIPLPEFGLFYARKTRVGIKQEEVCCSAINSGLFAVMLEHHDLKAVFCGHDHVNDFITSFDGLWLGYVRGVSYSAYGKDGFAKGSRVIQLHEGKAAFDTWLRLEDGQLVNRAHCK
jgi:hypothetical protein